MNVDIKSIWSFALAFAMLAPGARAEGPEDGRVHELNLRSGGLLIGEVKSHQPGGECVFTSPDATGTIHLKAGAVRSFSRLTGGDLAETPDLATFVFLSGDRVPAKIAAFDGTTFETVLPWATESRAVKWRALQRVIFQEQGLRRVFSGPLPDQEWRFTTGEDRVNKPKAGEGKAAGDAWFIENGALVSRGFGSASIEANLPDQISITYDLAWTGMLNMSVGIFSDAFLPFDRKDPDGPTVVAKARKNKEVLPLREGIAVELNQHSVILRSYSPQQGQDMLGSGQIPQEFRNRSSARVTVRIDRAAGNCAIWFGDRQVQKWTELGNLGGTGKGLSFWQHHGNGTVVIRRLVARTWNGKFEEESPSAEEDRDILVAADGTRLTGKLGAMSDGQFAMETSVGPLDVAMGELRHLIRARGKDGKSEREKPEGALVTLAGGTGCFHLEDFRIESEDGCFIGRHAELGELSLSAAEVESVDFHPDEEPVKPAKRTSVRKFILPGFNR